MFRRQNQEDELDNRISSASHRAEQGPEAWPSPDSEAGERGFQSLAGTSDTSAMRDQFTPAGSLRVTSVSVIAPNAHWQGTLQSTGTVQVFGEVDGDRIVAADLLIADGSTVRAAIESIDLTVAGHLHGKIHCTNRFEVLPTGEVHGEVVAPTIIVHEGARVVATLSMTEPDTEGQEEEPETDG